MYRTSAFAELLGVPHEAKIHHLRKKRCSLGAIGNCRIADAVLTAPLCRALCSMHALHKAAESKVLRKAHAEDDR